MSDIDPVKNNVDENKEPNAEKKEELSVVDAVASGMAVLKEDVDNVVAEAIAEHEKKIEKKVRKELVEKLKAEQLEKRQNNAEKFIEHTGLTDKEFGKKLIEMNVPQKYISVLRDEHAKLSPKSIWRYIQQNYKEKKKKEEK